MNAVNTRRRQPLSQEIKSITFSNPRRFVTVDDWPSADGRTQMRFGILKDDKGRERAIRWSTGKPKLLPHWHDRCRIVTGSNGRHYLLTYSGDKEGRQGRACVYRADMKPECVCVYDAECELWFNIRGMCYGQ